MLGQAIGTMEPLVNDRDGQVLQVPFSPAIKNGLMQGMEIPFEPTLHIGSNQINGILQAVRNTVLNWSLELEKRGILGEDMSFTSEEKQAAKEMQTITIENFQGVLGDVHNSTVTQNLNMAIQTGNFDSLATYLHSQGVSEADIEDLKRKIEQDTQPQSKDMLGPKVSSWIGKMVGKAASGGWKIAMGTAGSLLAQAIWLYYGFA